LFNPPPNKIPGYATAYNTSLVYHRLVILWASKCRMKLCVFLAFGIL